LHRHTHRNTGKK